MLVGNPEGKSHRGINGRIILKCITEIVLDGVYCINFVQDRNQWRAFVNTAMNLRITRYEVLTAVTIKFTVF
jgi:hypothetical protein